MRKVISSLIAIILLASACGEVSGQDSAQEQETESRQGSYEALVGAQPAPTMNYSPTRETVSAWIETWDTPGQVAFTYLLNFDGDAIGYYVLQGPPVSYCAALTPTYELLPWRHGDTRGYIEVPAPGVDGVYYSGGQCIQYYGIDATTGSLVEFTAGGSLNFFNSTQPLPNFIDIPNFGPTELGDVTPNADGDYIVEAG